MRYLAIDKEPYVIAYAVFDDKALVEYGTIEFTSKKANLRIGEINHKLGNLIDRVQPTVLLTHLLDLRWTMKKDLAKIVQIKTILRLLCLEKKVIYKSFRTYGWELRLMGDLKNVSPKRKLDIVREYPMLKELNNISVANAVILCEGVTHGRLQISEDEDWSD